VKGVIVREHGGAEALLYQEVDDPSPRADEVLVEVRATGVNHLDLWVRKGVPGHKFPLPLIPGNEISGVVLETGDRAGNVSVGDEVLLAPGVSCGLCMACQSGRDHHCRQYGILGESRHGGYAEKIVVPRENVLPKPKNLTFEEAASIPLVFMTAWHMLVARAGLKPGETVLVQAAGSGVGSAAIQVAKLWNAVVITTAGSDEKLERAARLGADHLINYEKCDFAKRVKEITGGKGADIVFEHVGEKTWAGSLRSLAWQGRLVTCGATTGADVSINLRHLFFKSLSILGSTMGSRGELMELLGHVESGLLKPSVHQTLPLADAAEAHRLLEERTVFGKIVLVP